MAFVCPRCGIVSYNRNDERERYCGRCKVFVDDAPPKPRVPWRRHAGKPSYTQYARERPLRPITLPAVFGTGDKS